MNRPVAIIGILVLLCPTIFGRPKKQYKSLRQGYFVLDQSKPYVYLSVDHIGPRKQREKGEPEEGIWLSLHNNCRMPIVIETAGSSSYLNRSEILVSDDVLANPKGFGGDMAATPHKPLGEMEFPNPLGIQMQREPSESKSELLEGPTGETMPSGYSYLLGYSVTLLPGRGVNFNLPINHVGGDWHFEIPFRFDLKYDGSIRPPSSHVAFYWGDLPEAYRNAHR